MADEFVSRTPNRRMRSIGGEGEYWRRRFEEERAYSTTSSSSRVSRRRIGEQRSVGGEGMSVGGEGRSMGGDRSFRTEQTEQTTLLEEVDDDVDDGSERSLDANNRPIPDFIVRDR